MILHEKAKLIFHISKDVMIDYISKNKYWLNLDFIID